jgi:OOP family OmpA-OmpF porin
MDQRVNGNGGERPARRSSASRGFRGVVPPLLGLLAVLAVPSAAWAQETSFYLDRLQIGGAPDDGIGIWRPQMGDKTRFFGQVGLGLSLNPFRVENYIDTIDQSEIVNKQNGAPVELQFITYVSAGVEILERFSFQLSFPIALYESGHSMVNKDANISERITLLPVAPMDLRLDGRVVFWRNETKTLKLGAIATLWLPTGNEYTFAGDTTTSAALGIAAEYDAKDFAVTLNTGYHFRSGALINEFKLADELTFGLGGFVPLDDGRFRIGGEVTGSLGIREGTTGDVDNTPIEWRLEGRMGLGEDPSQVWVGLSGGSRLTAGYAPDFRTVAVVGGWFPVSDTKPKPKEFQYVIPIDTDNDKLPDDIDMCPEAKEDGKGINHEDGCPETLNDVDSDGVPDSQDACPHEPGPKNADAAKNGCPEFIRRNKDTATIDVLQEVQFAFDRTDLLPPAFPILNEVVRLLQVNPDIELVGIEGHTDDFGTDKHNDELSQGRADSVMNYLIKRGIAPARIEAKGFGERRPIATNANAEGRQKNRRVEFHILKSKGPTLVKSTPTSEQPPGGTPAPGGPVTPPPGGTTTPPPAVPPKPGGTTAPVAPPAPVPPKPGGTTAPVAPSATTAPVAPPKPSGTTAPVAPPKPSGTTAPVAPPKPSGTTAPVAPPKPSGTTAPVAPPKPSGTTAPVAPPK